MVDRKRLSLPQALLLFAGLSAVIVGLPTDAARAAERADAIVVGAIRWDAWYGDDGPVTEVERSLGPAKFHWRLPFFASVLAEDKVRINGDAQEIIEKEMLWAAQAGLNYWAFVDYGDEGNLTIARRRYQAAADKHGLRFCLIEEGRRLDERGINGWPRLVRMMKDGNYQTVLDGRPLLFVFGRPERLGRHDFEALGSAAVAAGLKRPYLVLMGWNPDQDAKDMQSLGLDAVSAYAAGGQYAGPMWPYAELTAHVRKNYWEACRRSRIPTVTFATAGWDTRPRIEHPPSWCPWVKARPDPTPPADQKPLMDAVTATPEQLAGHLRDALAWTRQNADLNSAQAVIIYAWNENDEGGWLIPTRGTDDRPDTTRLEAVRRVLRPKVRSTQPAGE